MSFNDVLGLLLNDNKIIKFSFQRKGCKKHGHFKKRTNKVTNEISYEISIERNDNDAAKIYVLLHEFCHFINNHLDLNEITRAQKEYVCDYVALFIIKKLDMYDELSISKLSEKWDIDQYALNWIKGKKITEKKRIIMINQINCSISYFDKLLIKGE